MRSAPLAVADTIGDSFGANIRMNGSIDVSWKRNCSSASASRVSEMRPLAFSTPSRGDTASICPLRSLPRSVSVPVTCPTPSSATTRSFTSSLKSLRGDSNVPRPSAVMSATPDIGARGNVRNAKCSTGIRRPVALNE